MTKRPEKIYLVWETEDIDDECIGYFSHYSSIQEAIQDNPEAEIFEATPKSIGHYKLETKAIKLSKKALGKK